MNERFEERFPLQQLHDYHELTGHIARKGEIADFIQSEIDLAVAEERKRIINGITDIFIEADQREDRVELTDIENLITNK